MQVDDWKIRDFCINSFIENMYSCHSEVGVLYFSSFQYPIPFDDVVVNKKRILKMRSRRLR